MKRHLLILRLSAMGDVAMTVPVVRALAQQYPELDITVASRAWAAPIFESLGPQVHFFPVDLKKPGGQHRGLPGIWRCYQQLKALGITHMADLHSVLRSHMLRLLMRLSGVQTATICKHRSERRELCRLGAPAYLQRHRLTPDQLPSVFSAYADTLRKLGLPLQLSTDGRSAAASRSVCHEAAIPGEQIGIAPFAAHPGKELPLSTMEAVVRLLLQRHPEATVWLFGRGTREEQLFPEWQQRWSGHVQIASHHCQSISDELQLMSQLRVMLSMDSANQHLASLVGTRVVTVWGQTHPLAGFRAWQQQPADSVQADMPCRPCSVFGNRRCRLPNTPEGSFPCLSAITAQQIVDCMKL